jgi:hypothetical protein
MQQILLIIFLLSTTAAPEQPPSVVELTLQKINDDEQTKTPNNQNAGVLPLNVETIQKYIAANPKETRWGGKYDCTYFGVVLVLVPKTELKKDIRPILRNRAILLATNEAAFYKALEKYLGENGTLFTRASLFKQALLKTFSNYQFNGEYQKAAEFVFEENETIVGVVAVLDENIDAAIDSKQENTLLKNYIDLLQREWISDEQSETALLKETINFLQQKLQQTQAASAAQ